MVTPYRKLTWIVMAAVWFSLIMGRVAAFPAGGSNGSGGKEFGDTPTRIKGIRLKALEEDVKKEIRKYIALKDEIEKVKSELARKRDEKIRKVAKIYENMPAEEAARKLEKLDEETVALIVGYLKERSAGRILAQMSPAKAASISKRMLIHVRNAEKYLGK